MPVPPGTPRQIVLVDGRVHERRPFAGLCSEADRRRLRRRLCRVRREDVPRPAGRSVLDLHAPADEHRKSAIVTAKNPRRGKFGNVPDMTPEEHQQRGDAAEALFRELTHRVREA